MSSSGFLKIDIQAVKLYIPPFANVRLIEGCDFLELAPVPALREFFAYGKKKARECIIEKENGETELFWDDCTEDEEVWAVMQWRRFEDGHEEQGSIAYLRAPATEEDAREAMKDMSDFYSMSREEMGDLTACFEATEEDLAFIESRHPNYQSTPSGSGTTDESDLYQARLRVMAGMMPKTVALIHSADEATDDIERQKFERETVQAYFAELAHHWTEEEVLAWQRSNPVGTEWMCVFARVFHEPEKDVEPINYELAFNWLRLKYNLLTENELADAILVRTGQRLMPGTLKKRRDRLGLTTKRPTGPRPKTEG